MFRFKKFSVDQTGCAMKINTDGVLLGALVKAGSPDSVLDIGTGTGVISLMLAQRFPDANINAVEIDETAAKTADVNFKNSIFADRLTGYSMGFEKFFEIHPKKQYDLIVSNPPFYINSLQSPGTKKNLAKHAEDGFYEQLIKAVSIHLSTNGVCWLILPLDTSALVKELSAKYRLYLLKKISIHSFAEDEPHREILAFGILPAGPHQETFVIYDGPKLYSSAYKAALQNFLTIF